MSGKDLYDFIYTHGYTEYSTDTSLPDSLKPNPKSLDWLFAFPKMSKFLKWLLEDCPKSQILSYSNVKSYSKLPLKVSLSRIQDLGDLLDTRSPPDFPTVNPSQLSQELKTLICEQESEMKSLESLLKAEENYEFISQTEENDVETENQELEHSVLQYLDQFSQTCPVVSLNSVQNYLKTDEELTEKLVNYCNMVDLCVGAIDGSVFQRCLRSERAPEFTALCMEKQSLDLTAIQTHKQLLLASAALENSRTALKTFEKLLTSHLHSEAATIDSEISQKTAELTNLSEEIRKTLKKIDETAEQLQKIDSTETQFDDLEILIKKNEFSKLKMTEVQKMINQQKGLNLLALASVLEEMQKVQSEYDKLFSIQNFFTDIKSQSEFRLSYYPKYKIRSEILSDEMKTIDERNEFFTKICQNLNLPIRSTFEEIFAGIEKIRMLSDMKQRSNHENLQNFQREVKKTLFDLQTVVNDLREKVMTQENLDQSEKIFKEIWNLEEGLSEFIRKFELANEELVVGGLGITEREVFIEYLLSKDPLFFKECQFG